MALGFDRNQIYEEENFAKTSLNGRKERKIDLGKREWGRKREKRERLLRDGKWEDCLTR